MAFQEVAPCVLRAHALVRIGTLVLGKKPEPKNTICLNPEAMEHLGDAEAVDIFVGTDEDKGSLLIQTNNDGGEHVVRLSKKGAVGMIRVPLLSGAPPRTQKPIGCKAELGEAEDVKTITVTLPW